jgi:short-subunit dehydrogenase
MATTTHPSADRPLSLVTGASSGIGFELARKLAEVGYDIIVASSDRERLTQAANAIQGEYPNAQVQIVRVDLSRAGSVQELYETVQSMGRPIDILAANAGVGVWGDFTLETSLDDEIALINLNITSQVHLIKLFARDMVERGSGDILITSSIAGIMPAPLMAVYAASKAFLRSFGEAIRQELKDRNVNVTVLMPGPTDTDFFDRAQMQDSKVAQSAKQDPELVAESALHALAEGSDHVITGLKNKVQASLAKMMSDPARAKIHGSMTKRQ